MKLLQFIFIFHLNAYVFPTDYRHVPDTESSNVHGEILAPGNRIFPYIRRADVENLEVNLFIRFFSRSYRFNKVGHPQETIPVSRYYPEK